MKTKRYNLLRLFGTVLLIVAIVVFIDRCGGEVMRKVALNSNDVSAPKLRMLADSCNADVLILGTSRAHCHYVPSIIEDSLGMSVYNGGIDGTKNIYSHYFMLCQVLRHHKPKVLLMDILPGDFHRQKDPFTGLAILAPLFGRDKEADSLFMKAGMYYPYLLSHIYRYNARFISNLGGLGMKSHSYSLKGFLPLEGHSRSLNLSIYERRGEEDYEKLSYIEKTCEKCRDNGIRLVFAVSPYYTVADKSLYEPVRKIAEKWEVTMLDYHTSELFHNRETLFRDEMHLNSEGAYRYTHILAFDLKKILLQ